MIGRRRLGRVYLLGSLLLLAASLHPSTAYSAPGDPPSGSPASAVYELPLQQGRADAAPKDVDGSGSGTRGGSGAGGGGNAGGEGGEATSLYRSENNFGSSSQVPGLAAAGKAGGGAPGGAGGPGTGGGSGGPGGGAGGAIAGGTIAGEEVADAGNTSVPAGLALLGAIGLLAVGVAVLSRRYL